MAEFINIQLNARGHQVLRILPKAIEWVDTGLSVLMNFFIATTGRKYSIKNWQNYKLGMVQFG